MWSWLIGGYTHRATEGLYRDANILAQIGRGTIGQIKVADIRLREIFGQQPQAGDQASPAPFQRLEAKDFDLKHVTRLSALDEDRPRQRIETTKVQRAER